MFGEYATRTLIYVFQASSHVARSHILRWRGLAGMMESAFGSSRLANLRVYWLEPARYEVG